MSGAIFRNISAPDFEDVAGAYWFGPLRTSVRACAW